MRLSRIKDVRANRRLTGPEGQEADPLEALSWKVAVSGVVDGDTIEGAIPLGGSGELRLIGMDAPEGASGE